MQVVENQTELVGTIVSRERHPELSGYDVVAVKVHKATPVEGKADLLSQMVGTELPVTLRRALLDDTARPGAVIRFRAQRTPDGAMADTYPDPGTFAVGEHPPVDDSFAAGAGAGEEAPPSARTHRPPASPPPPRM